MRRSELTVSSEKRQRYEQGMGMRLRKGKWKLPRLRVLILGIGCMMIVFLILLLAFSEGDNTRDSSLSDGHVIDILNSEESREEAKSALTVGNEKRHERSFKGAGYTSNADHSYHRNHHSVDAHDKHVDESFKGHIYMDWMLPSEYFDYINYKSLESLLQVYPNAKG